MTIVSPYEVRRARGEQEYADLLELQAAVHKMGDKVVRDVHDDFIVVPLPPRPPEPKPAPKP